MKYRIMLMQLFMSIRSINLKLSIILYFCYQIRLFFTFFRDIELFFAICYQFLTHRHTLRAGLETDNEKVKNNLIFDTSKKSSEFLHSITKIKSREYR